MNDQQADAEQLREQMSLANEKLAQRNNTSNARLAALMEEEREQQASEREALMSQISALINSTTKKQQDRVAATLDSVRSELDENHSVHTKDNEAFIAGSAAWSSKAQELVGKVAESRDIVKNKLKSDFAVSPLLIRLPACSLIVAFRLRTRILNPCVRSRSLSTIRQCRRSRTRCSILMPNWLALMTLSRGSRNTTTLTTKRTVHPWVNLAPMSRRHTTTSASTSKRPSHASRSSIRIWPSKLRPCSRLFHLWTWMQTSDILCPSCVLTSRLMPWRSTISQARHLSVQEGLRDRF